MPVHDISGRLYAGLSTDTKPSVQDGWLFVETDTQDVYQLLAGSWTRILTLSHDNLTDISVDDHHAQAHSLASHSSEAHSELTGVGADDHHNQSLAVRKTADEVVNDSAVLQDDDHLFFSIGANEIWAVNIYLAVVGPTGADLALRFTVPSGASLRWSVLSPDTGSSDPANTNVIIRYGFSSGSTSAGVAHATQTSLVQISGVIVNGSTSGTVQLQWCQDVSVSGDTIIRANSYLLAHQIA